MRHKFESYSKTPSVCSDMGVGKDFITVKSGKLIICDPIALADVYNDENTDEFKCINNNGIIVDSDAIGCIGVDANGVYIGDAEGIDPSSVIKGDFGTDSNTVLILPVESAVKSIIKIVNDLKGESPVLKVVDKVKPGKYRVDRYDNGDGYPVFKLQIISP